jgi:hypothetical protein
MAKVKDDDARFGTWRIGRWMAEMTAKWGCGCLMELLPLDFLLRYRMAFFCGGVDVKISGMRRLTLVCFHCHSRAGAPFQGHDLEVREPTRRRIGAEDDQRRGLQDACRARRGCAACPCGLQPAVRALRCWRSGACLSSRGRCSCTRQRLRAPFASGLSTRAARTRRIVRRIVLVLLPNERPGACASAQAQLAAPPLALPLCRPGQALDWPGRRARALGLPCLQLHQSPSSRATLCSQRQRACRWAACAAWLRSQLHLLSAAKRF